ncbi:MAG: abortive infection family protein [Gammaproteobacteria bacterium]|nr:abortive infection family protein [Gammaproteobacteria bacterium]
MNKIPLDDSIAYAIAKLVDDAQVERRDPSHSDILFEIQKAGLEKFDPNKPGQSPVGKMKRVRIVLVSSFEELAEKAEEFAYGLLSSIRANGGFRKESLNYVGDNEIKNLASALKPKGILLGGDGSVTPLILDGLSAREYTEALSNYISRAKKGMEDSALIVGTSKDLMEAVAAHIIVEKYGNYPTSSNFPTLLGQAFVVLGMATSQDKKGESEHPRKEIERNLYDLACSINRLRNKQGTGHGRPWIPDLKDDEAKEAIQLIGLISDKMLRKLKESK